MRLFIINLYNNFFYFIIKKYLKVTVFLTNALFTKNLR
jgi:hypothetical protein